MNNWLITQEIPSQVFVASTPLFKPLAFLRPLAYHTSDGTGFVSAGAPLASSEKITDKTTQSRRFVTSIPYAALAGVGVLHLQIGSNES